MKRRPPSPPVRDDGPSRGSRKAGEPHGGARCDRVILSVPPGYAGSVRLDLQPADASNRVHPTESLPAAVAGQPVTEFLAARVVREVGAFILARQLYQAFIAWCLENDRRPVSEVLFAREALAAGLERKRSSRRKYLNIKPIEVDHA